MKDPFSEAPASETAKKYKLLEEETDRFVQDLVARAVEPPIERFRESAVKILEAAAAQLTEAREAVVQASGELVARVGSKLESLEEILHDALEDVPRRQDMKRLLEQAEARQVLSEGIMEALALLSAATTSGIERLASDTGRVEAASLATQRVLEANMPHRLEERFGAVEKKLASLDLTSFHARLEQLDRRLGAFLDEIGQQIASRKDLTARHREENSISSALAHLESELAFLQERSQAAMEQFRALAIQGRDLRGEIAAVSSQILALPVKSEVSLIELQGAEERLAGRVRTEVRQLMKAGLLSWGLLVLLLFYFLLTPRG